MSDQGTLQPFFSLRPLPTGRLVFSLKGMHSAAEEKKLTFLYPSIEEAIEYGEKTIEKEVVWEAIRGKRVTRRGDAVLIDNRLDQKIAGMESIARGHLTGEEDAERTKAAKKLHMTLFPAGVAAITQQSFEIQLERMVGFIEKCRTALAAEVQLLGLEGHVKSISTLSSALRSELEKAPPRQITWDQVRAARAEAHELLLGVVAQVLGTFWKRTPGDTEIRELLMAEHSRQWQLVQDSRRRKRPVLDVDPDTGEEIGIPAADDDDDESDDDSAA